VKGRTLLLVPAFVAALVINAGLFGLAAVLTGERRLPQDLTEPIPVSVVSLPPTSPPPRERARPRPRESEPRPHFALVPEPPPLSVANPRAPAVVVKPSLAPLAIDVPAVGIVFTEGELDERPRSLVRNVEYPHRAQRRGVEGSVRIKLLVRRDGTVGPVEILAADPPGVFEDAVLRAVRNWRFEPGRIAGEAVDTWVVTTVSFRMDR
jgi:protein TonB